LKQRCASSVPNQNETEPSRFGKVKHHEMQRIRSFLVCDNILIQDSFFVRVTAHLFTNT